MNCSMPGFSVLHHFLEFAQTHVHWADDAIQPSHPVSFPSAFNLAQHWGFFSNESVLHIRWPNYWSFSISPLNEYSGLIFFRINWLDLLAGQGTLKSPLQHHSLKASDLWHSAFFFIVQLSYLYMTTGQTIALTILTFVNKIMSLLLNSLSRFVIAFLPRSKCLLISCLKSPSAVILELPKIKSDNVSTVSPSICHDLRFLNVEL